MAGHTPWREITHKAGREWWSDLRFVHRARSREDAADAVERLTEEARKLGFRLELGSTSSEPPVDAPFR